MLPTCAILFGVYHLILSHTGDLAERLAKVEGKKILGGRSGEPSTDEKSPSSDQDKSGAPSNKKCSDLVEDDEQETCSSDEEKSLASCGEKTPKSRKTWSVQRRKD